MIDPLISKRQQLLLATQLCRMVLKVCLKSRIVLCVFVTQHHPFQSPSRLCHCPPFSMSGKRGSETTDAQAGALARYTRQTLCICGTLFDNMSAIEPCFLHAFLHTSLALFSSLNTRPRSTMSSSLEATKTSFRRCSRQQVGATLHSITGPISPCRLQNAKNVDGPLMANKLYTT